MYSRPAAAHAAGGRVMAELSALLFLFDLFCFTFRQQGIQRNEQVTPGGVEEDVCSSGRRPEVRNTLSGCIKEMIIYEL